VSSKTCKEAKKNEKLTTSDGMKETGGNEKKRQSSKNEKDRPFGKSCAVKDTNYTQTRKGRSQNMFNIEEGKWGKPGTARSGERDPNNRERKNRTVKPATKF